MTTNLAIVFTSFFVTNSNYYIHPSGVSGYQTNIVYQMFVAQTNALCPVSFTNSVPVSTSVLSMAWIPLKDAPKVAERKPLSIEDKAIAPEIYPIGFAP